MPMDNQLEDSFLAEEREWLLQWNKLIPEKYDDEGNKCNAQHTNFLLHLKNVKKQSIVYRKQINELKVQHCVLVQDISLVNNFEKQKCELQLYNSQKELLTIERNGLQLQLKDAKDKNTRVLQRLDKETQAMELMNIAFHREISELERQQKEILNAIKQQEENHILAMNRLEQNFLNNYSEINTCGLCYVPWDSDGVHRLVSLSCGHLFGDKCIREHLRQVLQCPICKVAAGEEYLRNIYGRNILPCGN